MAEERVGSDRSMEDILASIRKIISDDGRESGGTDVRASGEATQPSPDEPAASDDLRRSTSDGLTFEAEAPDAEGQHVDDDLADIVEIDNVPSAGANRLAIDAETESRPKTEPRTPSAAQAALDRVAGGDGGQWSRPMRVSSLTERLSLRERMAALDFEQNSDAGGPQNDVQPVARQEVAAEPRTAAQPGTTARAGDANDRSFGRPSAGTLTPGDVGPAVPSQEVPDRLTDDEATRAVRRPLPVGKTAVPEPEVQPADQQMAGAVETFLRDQTAAGEVAHGQSASVVETNDGSVIGLAATDFHDGASGAARASDTKDVGGQPKKAPGNQRSEQPGAVSATPVQPVQPTGGLVGREGVSHVPGDATAGTFGAVLPGGRADAPRDEKAKVIPSSNAVGVAALNEAGRRRDDVLEPSSGLVEAARDALHGDNSDARGAHVVRAADTSPSLEEVVRDALQPVLQKWLDDNLPKLIEKQLRDEVERALAKAKRDAAG